MNRREFLHQMADPLTEGSPPPLILLPVTRVPSAGSPRQYHRGTCVLVEDVQAWLCRDDGGFYAIDARCPHLGCLVRQSENGFACPCHRSRFNAAGERESGSAQRGLRCFYIDLDVNGHLVIFRDHTVDPRDRLMA